ncbi:hypothetical protein ETD86_13040 [Nonomuraea turkmeniaca]|uniref:Uncharacterized protein n=1 Tax=Nonomuraea turkmeniaca TaxID=103838 RepID=A0A5S4FN45_9ACTN|nr:hypothetical protein [Nonomuraea turkmeniaca]TMR22088.1 hypothetical protein ETD86_13040 [Nonomuraea turkmeniaca]
MGWISRDQQERDHAGLRHVCGACGHEERPDDPLVLSDGDPSNPWDAAGGRIHRSHTTDPSSGFYGRAQKS